MANQILQPPRMDGTVEAQIASLNEYVQHLFQQIVANNAFLPSSSEGQIEGAQTTADQALAVATLAASKIVGAGTVTVSDAGNTGSANFAVAQPDAATLVVLTPQAASGSPAAGSRNVIAITATAAGFTITTGAAPGVGESVTFNWIAMRA